MKKFKITWGRGSVLGIEIMENHKSNKKDAIKCISNFLGRNAQE